MKSRGILFFIFLLGISNNAFSQFTGYRLYTVADGLVQSEVVQIHQDKKGFLWVGTKNGVSRFDGNTFKTITDSAHFIRSWIRFIMDLDDSTVAIVSSKGYILFEYGRKESGIISAPFPPGTMKGCWNYRGNLQIIMTTGSGLVLYDIDRHGIRKQDNPEINSINHYQKSAIKSLLCRARKDGTIYFSDSTGQLCSAKNQIVTKLPLFPNQFFYEDKNQALYCITPSSEKIKMTKEASFVRFVAKEKKNEGPVRLFRLDGNRAEFVRDFGTNYNTIIGYLIIQDQNQILISDFSNQAVVQYRKNVVNVYHYDTELTGAFFEDREGNIWMGSPYGLVRSMPPCFSNYTDKQGLFPNGQFVSEDKENQIVAGSYSQGFQVLKENRFVLAPMPRVNNDPEIRLIYPGGGKDSEGNVVISATPHTALKWDGRKFFEIPGLPASVAFGYFQDPENLTEYFGALTGLFIREKGKTDRLYPVTPGNKNNKIVSIIKDGKGRILLGGFHGLTIFENQQFRHLPDHDFPYNAGANAMVKDHRGNVWLGNSDGLFFFDNVTFRKIPNPWFNELVTSFSLVDSATLFIGGLRGVGFLDFNRFYHEDTTVIRYFDRDNGFAGMECQQNAAITDHLGNVWIGATSSLVRIDPQNLPDSRKYPLVHISSVSHIDAKMRPVPLISSETDSGSLNLSYDRNNLRFDFTGIWFTAPGHLKFSYMLEGHESAWSAPGEERYAVYTNLQPGEYIFRVVAITDQGSKSVIPAVVHLIIRPAIWQTWWFWSLMAVIGISVTVMISWLFFRQIRNRQQKELKNQKTIAELRFKTLRNQLAPHFIFNALNAIGSSIFIKDGQETYDLLHKFSKLIRQSLMQADMSSIRLTDEMTFVKNYLDIEIVRFENRINYQFDVSSGVPMDFLVPRMIIQTFVENAVKHGLMHKQGPGMIHISIGLNHEFLHVEITDDGIGRNASAHYKEDSTGKGMEIIRESILLFNSFNEAKIDFELSDLFDSNGNPAGTRVNIRIPRNYNFSPDHENHRT